MIESIVIMMYYGFGLLGIRVMVLVFLYNIKVISFNIRDNGIGEEGGVIMVKLLRENYFIVELDMFENQFSRVVIVEIVEIFKENNTLIKFGFVGNLLDDKDVEVIC